MKCRLLLLVFYDGTFCGGCRQLRPLVFFVLFCAFASMSPAQIATTPTEPSRPKLHSKLRRYDQGPLKLSEFRRNTKDSIRGRANTMTRVMYEYKTYAKQTKPKHFEVELRSMKVYSIFLPEASWWNHPPSDALLDHEQGHFDIAEITARRLQASFRKALKSGKTIRGLGRSLEAAQKQLEAKLQKVIDLANKQSLEENQEYDSLTRHSVLVSAQAEYRRIQKLTLDRLAKQLKASE